MRISNLNVLIVSQVGVVWGSQLQMLAVAPRLKAIGVRLTLAGPDDGNLREQWTALGLDSVVLRFPPRQGLRRSDGSDRRPGPAALGAEALGVIRGVRAVARCIRAVRPDIVVSNNLHTHLDVALAGRITRCPVVIDLHDIVRPGAGRRVLNLAARLATVTMARSAAVAATAAGGRRTNIEVTYPGVDVDRFKPGPADPALRQLLGAAGDSFLVGILGRIDPEKGIHTLVEAVSRLPDLGRPVHLTVVGAPYEGTPDYVSELKKRSRHLLGDRVTFTGRRADIEAVVRCFDVLVNASAAEPFGLTVVEAQASGVPVIGTSGGGIPEFVEDGSTGLLTRFGDVDELTAALTRLLTDDELRSRLASAGRAQAETRFSLEGSVEATADLYLRTALQRQGLVMGRATDE